MHRDLGIIDDTVMLFGGPYSNLQAFEALLGIAHERQIGSSALICTGDVVAYCGNPVETVRAVQASGAVVVAGNCEQQLASGALDCGCGFEDGSTCDLLSAGWFSYASRHVDGVDCAWMADCPDSVSFYHQGARYGVVHGGSTDVARFLWSTTDDDIFVAEKAHLETRIGPVDHVISGHSGVPFIRRLGQGSWINAGVIGMPPHDGGQQTRFATLDGGEVLFHRLTYDVGGAVAAMEQAGLTQGYHTALQSGYWPSEDVLPEALRVPSLAKG